MWKGIFILRKTFIPGTSVNEEDETDEHLYLFMLRFKIACNDNLVLGLRSLLCFLSKPARACAHFDELKKKNLPLRLDRLCYSDVGFLANFMEALCRNSLRMRTEMKML
jgi:hypothetical protein